MRADLDAYKGQHEDFVSNLKGTSLLCVLVCLGHVPAFIMVLKLTQRKSKPSIIRDFALFMIPTLLTITILADLNYWSLLVLVVGLSCYHSLDRKRSPPSPTSSTLQSNPSNHSETSDQMIINDPTSYLTLFKGANVALTCLAILAIDFRVFPRKFGKTETFGMSLMDVGVGAFIFSSAITSKHARGLPPPTPPSTSHTTPLPHKPAVDPVSRILTICTDVMPLRRLLVLGLGFGRLVVLKAVGYHEHVSEYGAHWNFFMTLFSVWLVADVIHVLIPRRWIVWIALAWLSLYQTALSATSLTSFLLSSERGDDVLSANKEGILSLNGYIPLFLLAESLGHSFLHSHHVTNTDVHTTTHIPVTPTPPIPTHHTLPLPQPSSTSVSTSLSLRKPQHSLDSEAPLTSSPSSSKEEEDRGETAPPCPALPQHLSVMRLNYALLRQVSVATSVLWLGWVVCTSTVQSTSRRLCNASYVILVLAVCLTMVFFCHVADVFGGKDVQILTLQYMNRHSVIVFLAANLLTGLVNNAMRTIYAPHWLALVVLTIYAFLVTVSAWLAEYLLHRRVR